MLRSLSTRLVLAFALVIVLSLALSSAGTLLLLRNQERDAAEERVGRLAEPIAVAVALLEQQGVEQREIHEVVRDYAESFDVRIVLVDRGGLVVDDTESGLTGQTIDAFLDPSLRVTTRGSARFRMATYESEGEKLLVFAPAQESLQFSTNRLVTLQAVIFDLYASGASSDALAGLLEDLLDEPGTPRTLPAPSFRPLVAVPEEEITSAWQDLIPQLAIAGGIALLASALVAVLISRSVTRRLGQVTQAAQEMAKGNYDQQLDPRGEDEVGRLAQAFNVMARQVSSSHQMMRDLLANVSHELKTPLTSIQGFSQAMEEGAISSANEYEQAGRIINEETQRMRRLVDDLIDLSRLESGEVVMERGPVDVESLLRSCAERFEWQLREAGADLRLELATLPAVQGDERRLEQAFTNLIDNALRYAPRGGSITVRAEAENGVLRVAVHNTGSYIPPEELSRVFERFFQLDRNRSRGSAGAGLGLAIVSEVVQAHHGDVRATSDRDRGTEFVVTLPVAESPTGRHGRA